MKKGIFWIIDQDVLENNDNYFFYIETTSDGEIINADYELTSKNKDNYNHKITWESLPKELTHNKEFNYYPRGRVEIRKGKIKIYLNQYIVKDNILEYIKNRFDLNDQMNIKIIVDNSNHYQSKV